MRAPTIAFADNAQPRGAAARVGGGETSYPKKKSCQDHKTFLAGSSWMLLQHEPLPNK